MSTFLPRSIIVRRDAATKKTMKARIRVVEPMSFEQRMTWDSEMEAKMRARDREIAAKVCPPRFDPLNECYPPAWKPIMESPEFNYGWLKIFVDWDPKQNCTRCCPFYADTVHLLDVNTFLQHILETRGYDVDCAIPECIPKFLTTTDFTTEDFRREDPLHYLILFEEVAQAALTEINIQARMHGESYAFNGLEKITHGPQNSGILLMTFTVKQLSPTAGVFKTVQAMEFLLGERYLIGWRFKPEASAADCST